jgi:predicted dinucleotide-binding enzyme
LLQGLASRTRVVEAFTIGGFENLEDPFSPAHGVRPSMNFCGDEPSARAQIATMITDCGFDPLEVGGHGSAVTPVGTA